MPATNLPTLLTASKGHINPELHVVRIIDIISTMIIAGEQRYSALRQGPYGPYAEAFERAQPREHMALLTERGTPPARLL
jgi:hypothetical protein